MWEEEEEARQANPRLPRVWLGDAQVMQIFIPGLRNPDGTLSEIARQALHVLPHRPATQWQSLTKGGFRSAVWPNS